MMEKNYENVHEAYQKHMWAGDSKMSVHWPYQTVESNCEITTIIKTPGGAI